jgi:glycogen debranching enzyme
MAFKVQVGPPQIAIHEGQTVLITEPDGGIGWPTDRGLYFNDTRVVSFWALYANGEPWDLLNGSAVSYHAARIHLINRGFLTVDGPVPARTLGLMLSRWLDGGMHEDIDLTNHGRARVRFSLELVVRSDFAVVFEVRGKKIVRRGQVETDWSGETQTLRTTYRNGDFVRAVSIGPRSGGPVAGYANGRLIFEITLDPGQSWHCCLLYDLTDDGRNSEAPEQCQVHAFAAAAPSEEELWRRAVPSLVSGNDEFTRMFDQALDDIAALRLHVPGTANGEMLPAAGLPWYMAPFGRDSLIVSLQSTLIYPEFARGTLELLGQLQATQRDDYRDAEPGKIMHELRYGELAHLKLIPHTPYYGTADATPLYLILLHAAWRALGDPALIDRNIERAEACLRWIDAYGDRDGDGFQEYATRSSAGYENVGWKDSGDSAVRPDGSLFQGPKALCELQGYVYDAWRRMAEIFTAIGRADRAAELNAKADALYARFNDAFWDEEAGFYAYALDGEKRKVMSPVSNVGHCLWSGIIAPERAERVVARLMAPDMYSGWGIRTLSAAHPAFNPYSYHNGSVWPHDNGIAALGFRRYGFAAEALTITSDINDAASHFALNQLPELFAGIQRVNGSFPVQYLGANVPQAWAAGSVFMLMQALLGYQPDAPNGRLLLDPHLPDWMGEVTLCNVAVGDMRVDLRLGREAEETWFEVIKGDAGRVQRAPFRAGLLGGDPASGS